jgi:hypothetical protein
VLKAHGTVYGEVGMFPDEKLFPDPSNLCETPPSPLCPSPFEAPPSLLCPGPSPVNPNFLGSDKLKRVEGYDMEEINVDNIDSLHEHDLKDEDCLLKAKDLCVEYSFNFNKRLALNGLTFHIKRGERVALLGTFFLFFLYKFYFFLCIYIYI